ncbi:MULTISPECIES: hypothetical protein [unclassified Aureimonas]|uniref:hypothetical protein n=1 Tax=unclassified Aureimonas TaxID=2615206 RepID=UPI0006FA4A18|nr:MULTISPECIES: hypothetical protein [unclassified Aureimonas]KQT66096.1 hypothetical protein ASG62_19995 [Aureimonas sp. Leaf427]KQT81040.1 hypothetical protein ASG54_06255 [Aureimonas sp. Leaf460]
MIKIIAIGIWVCIATLGSSYAVATMQNSAAAEEGKPPPSYFVGLDYKKTEAITVPIISGDMVRGYVLATFVYTIDGETAAGLAVPPDPFILDEAYRAVYAASDFDFQHPERYDLAALTKSIKTAVNGRYKKDVIDDVLIDQFDFLPKDQLGPPGATQ